ncbi:hypothetical protein RMSM_00263 [Rhodopirellula maiorica SM1]|uniref:Uncharacterized protein n=1 Tax=Rhodopirellula maiorica SM1 TaxID=1265738 RepID=M5S9G7_9BACT|nr:hypothetical protein RMSM_00263 [Rhodopirellula maiorica SM1]
MNRGKAEAEEVKFFVVFADRCETETPILRRQNNALTQQDSLTKRRYLARKGLAQSLTY